MQTTNIVKKYHQLQKEQKEKRESRDKITKEWRSAERDIENEYHNKASALRMEESERLAELRESYNDQVSEFTNTEEQKKESENIDIQMQLTYQAMFEETKLTPQECIVKVRKGYASDHREAEQVAITGGNNWQIITIVCTNDKPINCYSVYMVVRDKFSYSTDIFTNSYNVVPNRFYGIKTLNGYGPHFEIGKELDDGSFKYENTKDFELRCFDTKESAIKYAKEKASKHRNYKAYQDLLIKREAEYDAIARALFSDDKFYIDALKTIVYRFVTSYGKDYLSEDKTDTHKHVGHYHNACDSLVQRIGHPETHKIIDEAQAIYEERY